MGARARLIALALAGAAGCKAPVPRCSPSLPTTLEVRNGAGALTWALRQSPEKGASDLCDGAAAWQGVVRIGPAGVTVADRAGKERLRLARDSDEVGVLPGRLRLFRSAKEARVLTPDGIPLASMDPAGTDGATVRAPSSLPIAKVQKERDAVAVRALDDKLRATVSPPGPPLAAGAFAVDALTPEERLAVYLYWAR